MLAPLAGTPYGDVPAFGRDHADDGLIVYLEACEHGAVRRRPRRCTALRLAGWFDDAGRVLIGRTPAPDLDDLTQHEAVADALGDARRPDRARRRVRPREPFLPLVNGALARVVVDGDRREITQTLGLSR